MSEFWEITDDFRNTAIAEHFSTLDQAYSLKGERVSLDLRSQVQKCSFAERNFYVKRYHQSGKYLRKYLGRSRVRAEWENIFLFQKWGIPTPEVVAYGEEKKSGAFSRGVLVTEELKNSKDMETFFKASPSIFFDQTWYLSLIKKLARHVRVMHDHHFTHNDLDWRNILLVNERNEPEVFFFDSPAGRFWWLKPLLEYRIVKDLAHLDKIARKFLTRRQRLQFYFFYIGQRKLSRMDKRRIRKILGYFGNTD